MKKKTACVLYLAVCIIFCLIPFAGMTVAMTNETTENRRMAEFPDIKKDNAVNINYLSELGDWFEDHFAFRNALVTADSNIQVRVFYESGMDSVIAGKDGWLFYSDTLDDYLGSSPMTERGIFNAANNLAITQRVVNERGARFLFTIAPNKNSLYGEQMPYYDRVKFSEAKNEKRLSLKLKEENVATADLFGVFNESAKVLYLKRDSHWNNEGAVLAFNTILSAVDKEHNTYETTPRVRTKETVGDLNSMLFPLGARPEWNADYQYEKTYSYSNDAKSVEDAWIETENPEGSESLLMFRDSFGNTLLPLMAQAYENGCFSKGVPYRLEYALDRCQPDTVIIEKVERNIDELAAQPSVVTGPEPENADAIREESVKTATTLTAAVSGSDTSFFEIKGHIDPSAAGTDSRVFIKISSDGKDEYREAFTISGEGNDYGYILYLSKETVKTKPSLEVIVSSEGKFLSVKSAGSEIWPAE